MSALRHEPHCSLALDRALAGRHSANVLLDPEVSGLVEVAQTLKLYARTVTPRDSFRAAARQRLLIRMARSVRNTPSRRQSVMGQVRVWTVRFLAGLTALGCAGAATATASASALPGDSLYAVKQVTEAVTLHLATTDSARNQTLLHHADARLDEATRLLQQGRADDAAVTAARYDDILGALTNTGDSNALQATLGNNEAGLKELLKTAPAPARPGLERALAATERNLNRPRPPAVAPSMGSADTVATSTAEPQLPQTTAPSGTDDADPPRPSGLRPDHAAEHRVGEAQQGPPASHPGDIEAQADTALADAETAVPSGESRGSATTESHAAPHGNAQPAPQRTLAPPGRGPQERGAASNSQPGGHGRP